MQEMEILLQRALHKVILVDQVVSWVEVVEQQQQLDLVLEMETVEQVL
jgi:hypothetical protein